MTIRPGIKDALWIAPGVVILLLLTLLGIHFYKGQSPDEQLALKARRVDLVTRMQADVASASEAEKSAVLAITDDDSLTFASQARAATAEVERERRELGELLKVGGTPAERAVLARFSEGFVDFQRVDDDLLGLAGKNTNRKAYGLAFGPGAAAVTEMNAALAHLVAARADSPQARQVMLLADDAQIAALRIETLLPPHIAEESVAKEDALEALMAKEAEQVKKDLDGLAALLALGGSADIATAAAKYARFSEIRAQILTLSRQNTNVRSLAISLGTKRKVMFVCLDALGALRQAILEEPIAGVTYGRPARPR